MTRHVSMAAWRHPDLKRVIDTLSAGFEAVTKRPWIILIPILLDLILWLGPHLSLQPIIEHSVESFLDMSAQVDPATWASMENMLEEAGLQQSWRQFGERFNLFSLLSSFNVLSFISLGFLDLPSAVAVNHLDGALPGESGMLVELNNGLVALLMALALLALGLVVTVLYQSLIAQQVREERTSWRYLAKRFGRYLLYTLMVAVALLALVALLGGPLSFFLLLVSAISPMIAQLLVLIVGTLLFWFSLYISFVPHGILLGEEPPVRALWTSVNIVHHDFWSILFLLVLIRVIRTGLLFVWPMLTTTIPGVVVSIVANAFVGAGLAAASLTFYRDSYVVWREHLTKLSMSQQ